MQKVAGERYVYKFVCDPDALFQMALAENHRTALKMEATSIAASTATAAANETNEYPGFDTGASNARCSRHQYSDMLNQVYTSHLHAQLNQQPPQPQSQQQNHGHNPKNSQLYHSHHGQGFEDYSHLHHFDPLTAAAAAVAVHHHGKAEKSVNNNNVIQGKPFLTLFGPILGHFFNPFWTLFGPFLDHFGAIFGPFLDHFCTTLEQYLSHFWTIFGPFLNPF